MDLEPKTIGMIGGVSWESTALYYKLINQSFRDHLGGLNSAKILLYSLNYDPIVELEHLDRWDLVGDELSLAAKTLQDGGAGFVILCCNTLHKVTPSIEGVLSIPFLHIADAAGIVLVSREIKKVGLLGTLLTMEDGFYADRLSLNFGLEVIIPSTEDRQCLDKIIYEELCQGKLLSESKEKLISMVEALKQLGAESVLLGCTELGLLLDENDVTIPVFDTTRLHANAAVHWSLEEFLSKKL